MSGNTTDDPRIGTTHNRALCCQCGTLRLVGRGYKPRDLITEHIWNSGSVERFTGSLRCGTCKACTRHALLLDCDERRDRAEAMDRKNTSTMTAPEAFARALGVNVVEVVEHDEGDCAWWIPERRTLEICHLMCPFERARVFLRILGQLDAV